MDFDRVLQVLLGLVVAALLALALASSLADGRIRYCYIQYQVVQDVPVYRLYGFRAWREDRLLKATTTFDDARDAAKQLGCGIR